MGNFLNSNINVLLKELANRCTKLTDDANNLTLFTAKPNSEILKKDNVYYWPYREKLIPFELLSDNSVLEFDREFLLDIHLRNKYETFRALRIAGSHLLPGAIYQLVISDTIKSLVIFKRGNKDYVIDYANNLIMQLDDYRNLFSYEMVEQIEQSDLVFVNEFFKGDNPIPIELMLISWSEVKKSLQRRITTFASKYELSGINGCNSFILNTNNDTETLFWLEDDYLSNTIDDVNFLFRFTLNPLSIRLDITKDEKNCYHYKDYIFHLFSDFAVDSLRDELLCEERYGNCFQKSIEGLFGLRFNYEPERLRLVLAKTEENEYESFYHAWVEFKNKKNGKWQTIDYTGNIMQESNEYIRLRKAKILNIIPYETMDELYKYLEIWKPYLSKFLVLYFGEEMLRDLEKNKSLFKGMQ